MFAENKKSALSRMVWGMGCISFRKFFHEIHYFKTRIISQSKAVFPERGQLKNNIITGILPQVKAGLTKIYEIQAELDLFKMRINDIETNKD